MLRCLLTAEVQGFQGQEQGQVRLCFPPRPETWTVTDCSGSALSAVFPVFRKVYSSMSSFPKKLNSRDLAARGGLARIEIMIWSDSNDYGRMVRDWNR